MNPLVIKINSLEDANNGVEIVPKDSDIKEITNRTAVMLERGCKSGKTSVMLLLRTDEKKYTAVQFTAGEFEALYAAYKGAVERFGE